MIGYIEYINPLSLEDGPGIRFVISTKSKKVSITSNELHRHILKYRHYYQDGGITIKDIDLEQLEFIEDLIKKCKMTNLNVCLILKEPIQNKKMLDYVDILEYEKV